MKLLHIATASLHGTANTLCKYLYHMHLGKTWYLITPATTRWTMINHNDNSEVGSSSNQGWERNSSLNHKNMQFLLMCALKSPASIIPALTWVWRLGCLQSAFFMFQKLFATRQISARDWFCDSSGDWKISFWSIFWEILWAVWCY